MPFETARAGSRRGNLRLEIAGLVFEVSGATGPSRAWIRERYAPFLCDKPPQIRLELQHQSAWPAGRPPQGRLDWENGDFRVAMAACRAEGSMTSHRVRLAVPPVPAALSPSLLRFLCALLLLKKGGFMLHAAGVIRNRRALVFCGPSEAGKTTIARLAQKGPVLNDETVAIVKRGPRYVACATPFFGEGGPVMASVQAEAPLRGLFFLRKATHFAHQRLTASQVLQRAFSQAFLPKNDHGVVAAMLDTLAEFAERVPCYDLFFRPHPELWEYLDGFA